MVEGHPQVWIDGQLHDLSPSDFADFSAGALRNALPLILFNGGLTLILILGAIALGVGLLVALPIAVALMYAAYCDIFA